MTQASDPPLLTDLMRFKPDGWTPNGWAVAAGVSRTVWSDIRRHGNPSRRTLEKLLGAAGSSLAEFEALRVGVGALPVGEAVALAERALAWGTAPPTPLPIYATEAGGERDGEGGRIAVTRLYRDRIVGHHPRHDAVRADPDAYALRMVVEAMWPRYRPGRLLLVSPSSTASVGDDVVVTLHRRGEEGVMLALIMELTARGAASLSLRQFTPEARLDLAGAEVESVHKIIGELF